MNIQLTEEIIRQRASAQSYQKGRDYCRPALQKAIADL